MEKKGPLNGIRIIDLTRVLAGPYCTMLLADMGAEVIKVEHPTKGDDSRGYPPFDNGISAYFANLNRNKKSITLDLKKPECKKVFWELIKRSDVLVENFKPGTMDKLGFSYEAVKEINPMMIYASISGFGQYGPYKELPGYDIIGQAVSGMMSVTGWPDSPPTRTGTAIVDVLGGLNCAIGILAALQSRHVNGHGDRIDISLVDAAVSAMETLLEIYFVEKRVPGRIGNRYEFIYPYDSFPASDGWVIIAVGNDSLWEKFCKIIGREDLIEEGKYNYNRDRVNYHDEVYKIVSEWSSKHTVNEIIKTLQGYSIPCSPIYTIDMVAKDPHIVGARGMIKEMAHPMGGVMKVVDSPIKFTETSTSIRTRAPLLGENNEEVLRDVLGMSSDEISILLKSMENKVSEDSNK